MEFLGLKKPSSKNSFAEIRVAPWVRFCEEIMKSTATDGEEKRNRDRDRNRVREAFAIFVFLSIWACFRTEYFVRRGCLKVKRALYFSK